MTNFSIVCGVYKYKLVKALLIKVRNLLNLEISWQVIGVTLLTTGLEPSTKSFGTLKRMKPEKQWQPNKKNVYNFPSFLIPLFLFFFIERHPTYLMKMQGVGSTVIELLSA